MSLILIILGVIIVIAVVWFLMKSLVAVVLVLGIIYLLFNIGFVWGAEDLEKFHLDKFLKPEVHEKIQDGYSSFSEKRNELGIVNTDTIKAEVDETLKQALTEASNELENVDKEQLIQDLSLKLQNFDLDSVEQALNELGAKLAKYNVTPEEVQSATEAQATGTTQP